MHIITQNNSQLYNTYLINEVYKKIQENIDPLNFNFSPMSYANMVDVVSDYVNKIAINIMLDYIEYLDRVFDESDIRKRDWHRKDYRYRTIITVFGVLTYKRRIYENIYTKECYTHVDRKLGLPRYDRFAPCVRALIIERYSMFNSMIKVGKITGEEIYSKFTLKPERKLFSISRQTIYNICKKSKIIKPKTQRQEETPKTIYIMADEKYIAGQDGSNILVKHGVIYEGIIVKGRRTSLVRPYVVSHIGPDFWDKVYDKFALRYDTDKVNKIYIMGDGASWIKSGVNTLPGSKFALDKFHLKQAINHISKDELIKDLLTSYIIKNRRPDFNRLIKHIDSETATVSRKETIYEKTKYIRNHWEAIQVMYKKVRIGCPMESAISHNIASIFSSVPKAYSEDNLKKYISYRDLKLNNYDIRSLFIASLKSKDDEYIEDEKPLNWSIFEERSKTDKATSSNWLKGFVKQQ